MMPSKVGRTPFPNLPGCDNPWAACLPHTPRQDLGGARGCLSFCQFTAFLSEHLSAAGFPLFVLLRTLGNFSGAVALEMALAQPGEVNCPKARTGKSVVTREMRVRASV